MALRVYNTLTRRKEVFQPRQPGRVDIYQCGITPYDHTHVGHARQYVFWDVVRKYLKYRGYEVFCVQNLTDVDDKIIARSQAEGRGPGDVAEEFNVEFLSAMDALAVARPEVYPRVTEHIEDIIKVIDGLIRAGHAYQVDGDVYFDVKSFPGYGKLSHRNLDEMKAGARVEVDERKKDPMDFALWKAAKPGEPSWESPWGPGRPGWHIECSAMALKYLGSGFDFHGGGTDLIFPHHENEIAQSEGYTGQEPFVRYWVHHEMLLVGNQKMSKSLKNFFLLRDVLKRYRPEVLRYFLLSVHYRTPASFGEAELDAAERGLERLENAVFALRLALDTADKPDDASRGVDQEELRSAPGVQGRGAAGEDAAKGAMADAVAKARARFVDAMDDDFNTAIAISVLHDLARESNTYLASGKPDPAVIREVLDTFYELGGDILGIVGRDGKRSPGAGEEHVEELIKLAIDLREKARKSRDYATADEIRDRLASIGITLEDTPSGTRWKWRRRNQAR